MSKQPAKSVLGAPVVLQKFVFRPLAILVTSIVLILALVQSVGRISVGFVSDFTPEINAALQPLNVKVTGVSTSWRGLNPVVAIAKLEFGAGHIDALEIEVALIESMRQATWIPALLTWDQFHLYVDQTEKGWRLRNQGDVELPFDLERIAQKGNRIFGSVEVYLSPLEAELQNYSLDLDLANHGSVRSGHMSVGLVDKDLQPLTIGYLHNSNWLFPSERSEKYFAQGSLTVPAGLIADSEFLLSLSSGYLNTSGDVKAIGQTNVRVVASKSPLLADNFSIDFVLRLQSLDHHFVGALSQIVFANPSQSIELTELLIRLNLDNDNSPFGGVKSKPILEVWSETQNIGSVSDFLIDTTKGSHVLSEWLVALRASGVAQNLHLFVDPELGFGYATEVAAVGFQGYRGVPSLSNASAKIWGDSGNIAMTVQGEDMTMLFPDLFYDAWQLDRAVGELALIVRPGYVALRGENIVAQRGDSTIAGEFATSRPQAKYEQRVAVRVKVDTAGLDDAQSYVPYKLSPGLYNWLKTAPEKGRFDNVELALQSQIHVRPERKFDRRFEMSGDFNSVQVSYLQDWPRISNARGRLRVLGLETVLEDLQGESFGIEFSQAQARIDKAGIISIDFIAAPTGQRVLDFIRSSPLKKTMAFIEDDWRVISEGIVKTTAHLEVPLTQNGPLINSELTDATPNLSAANLVANLSLDISDVSLDLPGYKLMVQDISGPASFSLPHHFHSQLSASMFERPAVIASSSDERWLNIDIDGQIGAEKVLYLLSLDAPTVLQGETAFSSRLNLSMQGDVSNFVVQTDLLGMNVDLPAEFGKAIDVPEQSEFTLKFLPEGRQVGWQYKSTEGWLVVNSEEADNPLSGKLFGAVGIATAAPAYQLEDQTERTGLKVVGLMPRLDIADWVSGEGEPAVVLPFDWQIESLAVGELIIGDFAFEDVSLDGLRRADKLTFDLRGDAIIGRLDLSDLNTLGIDLSFLRLPENDQYAEDGVTLVDPMSIEVGRALPRANVRVGSLHLGDESFGAWVFNINPEEGGVRFDVEAVDVKGVHIQDSVAFWDLDSGTSSFSGAVQLDNLFTTLPAWGYVPVVETDFARLSGNLSWPGSPANLNIVDTEGGVTILAKEGRFLDVEAGQGGLRLVSLFNVSALAKRISLDFSDVVDEGISFSRLAAEIQMEDKQLSFNKNLIVKSTSSTYELGGAVDFRKGTLENEMIVTLPVSDSLPWYAAYVAIANPLAGIGVAVGERILRKPIQRMSSAKFSVAGSIDDPEVKFLTLWGQSIDAMPEAGERLSPDLLGQGNKDPAETQDKLEAQKPPSEEGPLLDTDAKK